MKPNKFFERYMMEDGAPTNSAAGGGNGSAIAGIGQKGPDGSPSNFAEPGFYKKLKRTLFKRKKK